MSGDKPKDIFTSSPRVDKPILMHERDLKIMLSAVVTTLRRTNEEKENTAIVAITASLA